MTQSRRATRPTAKRSKHERPVQPRHPIVAIDDRATRLVREVCGLAGRPQLITEVRRNLSRAGVIGAVKRNDTAALYDWMARGMAYQGISDYVAEAYMQEHGSATWHQIEQSLTVQPLCSKLRSYWAFDRCGYNKTSCTCNEPKNLKGCPLPSPTLRNGRLNQSAFSLYFFMRDVAGGDFVNWLDTTIANATSQPGNADAARSALLDRLRYLFGLSNKMLTMILSDLLIGAARDRRHWLEVGASMIVVDTLVHNFLHRTGILQRHGASHLYGPLCYGPNGCADIIRSIARKIDARAFNASFPARFPRFVQHAIWRFCAQQSLDICNGNRIRDDAQCKISWCPVFADCGRVALRAVL